MTEQFEDGDVARVLSEDGKREVMWVKRSRAEALEDMSKEPTSFMPGTNVPLYASIKLGTSSGVLAASPSRYLISNPVKNR